MEMEIAVQVVCATAPVPLLIADWGLHPLTPCCHATAKPRMGEVVCCACHREVNPLFGRPWLPDDEQGWAIYKQLLLMVDEDGGDPLGGDPFTKAGQIVAQARCIIDAAMAAGPRVSVSA